MKKFDIKDVFSWSNAKDAEQYIDKYCYFADSLRYLKIIVNKDEKYILKEVFNNENNMVQGVFCDVDGDFWGLCLPAEKVIDIEEPKKYRPFKSIDEFFTTLELELGQSIVLRNKFTPEEKRTVVFTGYVENGNELTSIQFGKLECLTATFYESYEVYNDNTKKWQPFGVLEE